RPRVTRCAAGRRESRHAVPPRRPIPRSRRLLPRRERVRQPRRRPRRRPDRAREPARTCRPRPERPAGAHRPRRSGARGPFLGDRPALSDGQVREVARLVLAVETADGIPVDIECAFAGESLYLLQSRPITTLRAPVAFDVAWEDPADATLTWTREDVHMDACRP